MLKFLSEFVGSKIILFQEQATVGDIKDYLVDHEKGILIGVFTENPIDKKKNFIPTSEIKGAGEGILIINDLNSLTDIDEIVRAKNILKTNAKIISEFVETESGTQIGKVTEAAFEIENFKLNRLYVRPRLGIKNLAKEIIIPENKILEIKKKKIIISDELIRVKKSVPAAIPIAVNK